MQGIANNNQSGNLNNNNSKWVINLSKTSLTEAQESLLAKGPNFTLAPSNIHSTDYITVVESICSKLKEQEVQELRVDVNSLLRRVHTPKPNLTKQERRGFVQLKKDNDRLVLTADKGVTMVVIDKEDYIHKAKELLGQPAYRKLDRDLSNRIKAKLITNLRTIKKETRLDEGMYKIMYPTSCVPPKFYGLPKVNKTGTGTPLRPIVSSRGSVTYGVATGLTTVLKPLVGKYSHHVQCTSDCKQGQKDNSPTGRVLYII